MAIQATVVFNGVSIQSAYIRINRVFGGKIEGWSSLVDIYADATHAKDGVTLPIYQINCSTPYDPNNLNALDLIYIALLKRPEFVGATSV